MPMTWRKTRQENVDQLRTVVTNWAREMKMYHGISQYGEKLAARPRRYAKKRGSPRPIRIVQKYVLYRFASSGPRD